MRKHLLGRNFAVRFQQVAGLWVDILYVLLKKLVGWPADSAGHDDDCLYI